MNIIEKQISEGIIKDITKLKVLYRALTKKLHPDVSKSINYL